MKTAKISIYTSVPKIQTCSSKMLKQGNTHYATKVQAYETKEYDSSRDVFSLNKHYADFFTKLTR